ncbi:putative Diguanylate cyclase [Candidatus Desulfosporosinus infrequens]|uniref:Putative Diguanylate cyclase n=1 Tax=Candidatus Desulfosporosinus infrequens TaxID=2043169 RepID=A0A2U3LVL0_9FIRM|nr:putative Diguanylate cyclase [Candidatus Desulfosporosinus infrequens]
MFYLDRNIINSISEIVAYFLIVVIMSNNFLSLKLRKIYFLVIFYFIGIGILVSTGTMGAGMVCILFTMILSGCLLERREIRVGVLVNLFVFLVLTHLVMGGYIYNVGLLDYKRVWFINAITTQACGIAALIIMNTIFSGLENQIKVIIAKEEEVYQLAFNDHLTGLPNRRLFYDRLGQAILHAARNEQSFEILFLDLDGFKMINDTMGHAMGDELLKKVAERLSNTLRNNDVIARVGGDEFLILIHNAPNKESIEKVCKNIINVIKEPFEFPTNEIYITTSIGVSIYPQDGDNVETLVKNADIAMYVAKENGKGKYAFCNELMKKNLDEVMMLSNDLYRALESNELEIYYQPQVDSRSGSIIGMEALLRWNHPKLGLIGPCDFIPIAEKTGLIVSIGEWVLRTACTQTKAWQDSGFPNLSIAVNLSVNQISSRKLVNQVSKILIETGISPKYLELEITESIFMKDISAIVDTLKELKSLEIRIAIDDFGTDYSSLSYLKKLPLDRIKIAKTFIDGINLNHIDESIISAIIVLGKRLGLDLIAEGVETEGQLQFLQTQMCDEIQGYYFYRPMPVQEIDKLFQMGNKHNF